MSFNIIVPLIALGLGLILTALVLHRNYRSTGHRLFSIFLFGMAMWGGLIFAMRASPDPQHALIWERAVMPWLILAAVMFFHFSFLRTRRKPNRWLITGAYFFLLVVVVLSPTELIVKDMGEDPYGYFPIAGPVFYLIVLFPYFTYIYGMANLVKGYRSSTSYEERNSYLYMLVGVAAFLLRGIIDISSIWGIPIPPMALVGNIVFCLLTSIAMLKYHLLDIHLVLRKGTAYFLISVLVVLPYASTILIFYRLFEQVVPPWAYFILLVLIVFTFQFLWNRTQQWVDRLFYRRRYDFLQELEQFSREVHDISDLRQLGSSLVQLISRALQTSSVQLLLHSESGAFTVLACTGEKTTQLTMSDDSPLLRWLRLNKGLLHRRDLDSIPQLQALPAKDINALDEIRAEIFVPLKTKQDELIGLLVLGEKLSQQPYSQEDKRLVSTVTTQVATELENARLYDLERTMRKELEKQDNLKTEFLHSVGHELKTPLTAILSSSELLAEKSLGSSSIEGRLVNNIRQSASSMNRRVTELLDLAKIRIGELRMEPKPLEMAHFAREVASQLHILFESKEQMLTLEVPDSLPKVNGDKGKLEQVLFNLLSNANKFSPTGSHIVLRAKGVDGKVIIEVEDSAPAITKEEKLRLFDPYYRGENAEKRQRFPGLGLGLSIAKKIVELHQGQIWVDSKSKKGNTFAFSLPALNQNERD